MGQLFGQEGGLDAGFPTSKRSKTAQQPAALETGQTAGPEADPFSKPKPTRKILGPRQQIKAAGAAARSEAPAKGTSRVRVPNAPRLSKCGTCRHCTHPKLKQGCLWISSRKLCWLHFRRFRCLLVTKVFLLYGLLYGRLYRRGAGF